MKHCLFSCHGTRRHLHSFPTRRSSDLQLPIGTLGDTIGWFPYVAKFREAHNCRLTCAMAEKLIPLFRDAYPDINFVTHERSEEHTSELQSPYDLVCRLLLEKKRKLL